MVKRKIKTHKKGSKCSFGPPNLQARLSHLMCLFLSFQTKLKEKPSSNLGLRGTQCSKSDPHDLATRFSLSLSSFFFHGKDSISDHHTTFSSLLELCLNSPFSLYPPLFFCCCLFLAASFILVGFSWFSVQLSFWVSSTQLVLLSFLSCYTQIPSFFIGLSHFLLFSHRDSSSKWVFAVFFCLLPFCSGLYLHLNLVIGSTFSVPFDLSFLLG